MRLIIDTVLRKIYSNTVHMRPDIKKEIGEFDEPQNLNLSLEMFPCYRSILNKITETCFSMAQVRIERAKRYIFFTFDILFHNYIIF